MPDKFSHRSYESELLDDPHIPKELLFQNLRELDFINRTLGGHRISMKGIKKLVTEKNKIYHIADLGCGGGDIMKCIARWAKAKGFKVKLTGVDRNADVINYLREYCKDYPEIASVVSDYRDFLRMGHTIDIIHCSLFCHHLKDAELTELFSYMNHFIKTGFIINDLQRNWLAYYGVQIITHLLNGSKLSKNDGPISILRAFRREEINTLLQKARIEKYSLNWKWAFRYLVIGYLSARSTTQIIET
jgi:2-polyprenyl-3-methyl-5-hydroxy-6-metoxy-1,4-benzoquinol methylase